MKNAGRPKPALEAATAAISTQQKVISESPDRVVIREDLFDSMITLAEIRLAMREFGPALDAYREGAETCRRAV